MINRRIFGRLFAGAAAAASSGPSVAASRATNALQSLAGGGLQAPSPGRQTADGAYDLKWRASKWLRKIIDRKGDDLNAKIAYRDGPFEPDIACLRSVSTSAKVRWQVARDIKARREIEDMRSQLALIMGWEE